ncbi:MAG: lipoprotein [Planctomycetaceae bacterium]|nr:lipoprotein [Planctomycetaceae bacterium]
MRAIGLVMVCALCVMIVGCGRKGPPMKKTYKVTGKVLVDGKEPGSSIQMECHNTGEIDRQMHTFSQSNTKDDGTFEIATYTSGDGVPAGEYKLTFAWQEFNLMSRSYGGPDKLKKRYSDPGKAEIKFSVVDKSVNLGEINLTTK